MKTIIVVTIFGILTCAYPTDGEHCAQEKAMEDFDPSRFFNGKWYVVHYGKTGPTVCQKFSTNGTQGAPTQIVETGYDKFEDYLKFQCDETGKKNDYHYSFKCKSYECGSDNIEFEVDFTVLSASYDDFALVCRTITFTSGTKDKDDEVLVLEREKTLDVIDNCRRTYYLTEFEKMSLSSQFLSKKENITMLSFQLK
uniref:Dimiconin n=1 Tax=Triatoma dimidiata TaxID=72491 RepID=TD60_TRIDM|nr:hypothetical protein Td60 similar to triabin precursor [Triatoma dimidiata]